MRNLIIVLILWLALAILAGCKSQTQSLHNASLSTDSIARSEHHQSTATLDSMMQCVDFSFDSLTINIEQPVEYADRPLLTRITATKGRWLNNRVLNHNQVVNYNRLDTVAYKIANTESSANHSASTRGYNPPNGTVVASIALIIAAVLFLLYLLLRKY